MANVGDISSLHRRFIFISISGQRMGRGGRLCLWRRGDRVILFCLARPVGPLLGPLVRHGRGRSYSLIIGEDRRAAVAAARAEGSHAHQEPVAVTAHQEEVGLQIVYSKVVVA